jgi:predicted component of type VI protein secretion system
MTSEEKISTLYNTIEESEESMRRSFEELKDAGLTDILDIVTEIRRILLAGFSPEETVARLKSYCESVSGEPQRTEVADT